MMLGVDFVSPWLLLGLLAAGIPVVLHLLSAVRAQEVYYPTLRFLRLSMEKTARRRRLEHWLLLLLRSALLAMLALAVAQPILKAATGLLSDQRVAAAIVLDNSYSMAVQSGGVSRFETARQEALKLLSGQSPVAAAAVLLSNDPAAPGAMQPDLAAARQELSAARLSSGKAALAQRVSEALKLLARQNTPQQMIYVLTDLQRNAVEPLTELGELKTAGVPLMIVDTSAGPAGNVGIAELAVNGKPVVDQALEFSATLVNSSPTDKIVTIALHVDGQVRGEPVRKTLAAAGSAGAQATVRFRHVFTAAGFHAGQAAIEEEDELAMDNVRRFSLLVAERAKVLLVRPKGAAQLGGSFDPAAALALALDPFGGPGGPWSIELTTVAEDQLDKAALAGQQAAFVADVPALSVFQADALEEFTRGGGTSVFFAGPGADVANWNLHLLTRFKQGGGLLPAALDKAVGQAGLTAEATLLQLNLAHPYLAGIYESPADYPKLLVQRFYRLTGLSSGVEKVIATPAGEPIVCAKPYHAGRVVLFATTASAEWNNLATSVLLLPMVTQVVMESAAGAGGNHTYAEGSAVAIQPRANLPVGAALVVTLPDGKLSDPLPFKQANSVTFTGASKPGLYTWQVTPLAPEAPGGKGSFAVNADGAESDLSAVQPQDVTAALKGVNVYVGKSIADVNAQAAAAAAGENLWDRLTAIAILLLVVEAIAANRFRHGAEPDLGLSTQGAGIQGKA